MELNFDNKSNEDDIFNTNKVTDIKEEVKPVTNIIKTATPKVLDVPQRVIPTLIEEIISKGIIVTLEPTGYGIGGFYEMGQVLLQHTDKEDTFAVTDNKGKKHFIKNFNDLLIFHKEIWKAFYKNPEHRRADIKWFNHLYDANLLDIIPAK